jgi:hypothetical protein
VGGWLVALYRAQVLEEGLEIGLRTVETARAAAAGVAIGRHRRAPRQGRPRGIVTAG